MCFLTDIVRDLNTMEHNGGECAVVIDHIEYTVKAKKRYTILKKKLKSISLKLIPSRLHGKKEENSEG